MSTILIAIFWLALFHFVYESIIAPSVRIDLRNRLFVVRDQIRAVMIDGVGEEDKEAFWLVHNGINSYLTRLPYLTVSSQIAAIEAYRRDKHLRDVVEAHLSAIERCDDIRIRHAFDRAVLIVGEALVVNSGGWLAYLLPAALVAATFTKLKRLARNLVLLPDRAADRLLPQPC